MTRVALFALLVFWALFGLAFVCALPGVWANRGRYEHPSVGAVAVVIGLVLAALCGGIAWWIWSAL